MLYFCYCLYCGVCAEKEEVPTGYYHHQSAASAIPKQYYVCYLDTGYEMNSPARNQVMMGEPVYLAYQNQPLQYQQDNIYSARP